MLFMLFVPPMPVFILFMLLFGCDRPPSPEVGWPNDDVEVCLGIPPGGGGKLKPDGVLLPLYGGGGSEKEDEGFMAGVC